MGGPVLLLGPLVLLAALAVAVVAAIATPRRQTSTAGAPVESAPLGSPAAIRARRHMNVATALAWTAFVGTAIAGAALAGHSHGLAAGLVVVLTPAGVGTLFLLVHLLGELTWPRPTGDVRRAVLQRRHPRQVLGRGLVAWTGALLLAVVGALLVGGLTADPTGRSVSWTTPDGLHSSSSGPYPGWPLAAPLLVASGVVAVLTALVLRLIVARAAVADTHELDDLALRRASASRVLAGSQLVLGLTTAGVVLLIASAWSSIGLGVRLNDGATAGLPASWLTASGVALAYLVGLTSAVVAVVSLAHSRGAGPTVAAADASLAGHDAGAR